MYILYPKWLIFAADSERHVQAVITRLKDPVELLGNVDAVIGVKFDHSLDRLKEVVRSYLSMFPDVRDQKVLVSDFQLVYCTSRISWDGDTKTTGVAGSPGRVVSEVKL